MARPPAASATLPVEVSPAPPRHLRGTAAEGGPFIGQAGSLEARKNQSFIGLHAL